MNNVDFNNLKIIKHLKEINSDFYFKIVDIYSFCEKILGEIPKLFSNYTMHDINHSIRVIKYMTDFLKEPLTNYSELHLAAIVYVGLLHDIGMFASDDEIIEIRKNLKEKHLNKAIEVDDIDIQNYVRINHGKRVAKNLELKMNNGSPLKTCLYVNSYDISDIIASVCRSHQEDCEWIEEYISGTRNIANYSINPIHLAILLRLGDALDIDDRRAPLSLYYALSPKGLSDKEWRKHVPITNYEKIVLDNDTFGVFFEGESDNPEIFMALKHYIDDINVDIIKINRILEKQKSPYSFIVNNKVDNRVIPIDFSSEEVTFNVKYKQIKKLLMGENLYGGRENGLREILQNSIDAVSVMKEINSSKSLISYEPTIEICIDKGNNEIVITDNGIGMSKNILNEYFFNIGNSYYQSNRFKEAGYEYKAIGKFGIGFLACFMLSSEVSVITKHYESTDIIRIDLNNNSDLIITRNVDAFPANSGTQVILRYDDTINEVFNNEENLIAYINDLLIVDKYKLIIKNGSSIINIKNSLDEKFSRKIHGKKMDVYYEGNSFFEIIENCLDLTEAFGYFVLKDNRKSFCQEYPVITIEYAYEVFTELEKIIATKYEVLTCEDLIELFSSETSLVSDDIQDFLFSNLSNIFEYYCLHENLVGFLDDYIIRNSRVDDTIVWKEIPYFKDSETYNRFWKAVSQGNDYQEMLLAYNVNYIPVFCAKELDEELQLEILRDYFILFDYDIYFDYWDEYGLEIIEKSIPILEKNSKYISVVKNYKLNAKYRECNVYVNGIWIPNINIVLPFVPTGFEHKHICINITTDEYETTIARDDLIDQAKTKFINDFVKDFLFGYISSSTHLSSTEKQLIEMFLNKYYND